MSTAPAIRIAEDLDDAATEVTIADGAPVLVDERCEDDDTQLTDIAGAPLKVQAPSRPAAKIAVVPDPSVVGDAARSEADDERLALQAEVLRLRREVDRWRRQAERHAQEADDAREALAEVTEERDGWERVAADADLALGRVAAERDHYRGFAESGLLARIRGCDPIPS